MYKKIMFSTLLTLSAQLHAQPVSDDPARATIGQTGHLFTIKWTPKSRKIEVGVIGKEAVSIDPKKVSLLGRIVPAKGEPRTLRIEPAGKYFQILDPVEPNSSLEIEVKDKSSQKSENFKIHAKP